MKNTPSETDFLPHLADLIDYGEITLGTLDPVGGVATAIDGSNCLAIRHPGYALSLSRRWLIEKSFGWLKQTSQVRQVKLRGLHKVDWIFVFSAAHNLMRLPRLIAQQPGKALGSSAPENAHLLFKKLTQFEMFEGYRAKLLPTA